jgi:hypothetical protein
VNDCFHPIEGNGIGIADVPLNICEIGMAG